MIVKGSPRYKGPKVLMIMGTSVVVCGVSGAGKTTVGQLLARRLDLPYAEGDDFHPPANVAKMARGVALDDTDRAPWLDAIAAWLRDHADGGGVIACSALKRRHRDRLRQASPAALFVQLTGPPELLAERIGARSGHFMPPQLLESQLADLEPLAADEAGLTVDIGAPPAHLVDVVVRALAR